jgi:hypothetical protein
LPEVSYSFPIDNRAVAGFFATAVRVGDTLPTRPGVVLANLPVWADAVLVVPKTGDDFIVIAAFAAPVAASQQIAAARQQLAVSDKQLAVFLLHLENNFENNFFIFIILFFSLI